MDVQIKTKNLRLTDGLQDYIESRVRKLDRVSERVSDAKFEVRTEKNRTGGDLMVAQFTIATKNAILRTEEKNRDIHVAIDLAVEHMARQIRRFHDKKVFLRRRQRQMAALEPPPATTLDGQAIAEVSVEEEEDELPIEALVRRKRFQILPMGEDEAIEQMELLGHDFFVFFNPDDAQINVLYRRRDGGYGLIQPELA